MIYSFSPNLTKINFLAIFYLDQYWSKCWLWSLSLPDQINPKYAFPQSFANLLNEDLKLLQPFFAEKIALIITHNQSFEHD